MNKKKITIHTSLFELQLYWRSKTVYAQLTFMAVMGFMIWLGVNDAVKKFSTTILLLDLAVVSLYALIGLRISSEDISEEDIRPSKSSKKEDSAVAESKTIDSATVDHSKVDKSKVVGETSDIISNMVGGDIKVPTSSKETPPPDTPQPQPDILSPQEAAGKNLEDTDMDALMNFFGDGMDF